MSIESAIQAFFAELGIGAVPQEIIDVMVKNSPSYLELAEDIIALQEKLDGHIANHPTGEAGEYVSWTATDVPMFMGTTPITPDEVTNVVRRAGNIIKGQIWVPTNGWSKIPDGGPLILELPIPKGHNYQAYFRGAGEYWSNNKDIQLGLSVRAVGHDDKITLSFQFDNPIEGPWGKKYVQKVIDIPNVNGMGDGDVIHFMIDIG